MHQLCDSTEADKDRTKSLYKINHQGYKMIALRIGKENAI